MSGSTAPLIIQGGMGVAVSDWTLARAVAMTGQLGVVSGTALEIVCARRLQLGDPGGHVRRALARLPLPGVADRILRTYHVPGGKPADAPFRPVHRFTLKPSKPLQELTIAANFVEVFLAKEGHGGTVGVNYLRKIELPLPFECYGSMLAGVDHILVGAGNPGDLPPMLDRLARHEPVTLPVRVHGATSSDGDRSVAFDPGTLYGHGVEPPVLRRPFLDAIVASSDLAEGLAADPTTRPDGFVVEGHIAGGHNAPPRGPRRIDARGQPIYDERDVVDPRRMVSLGEPFWMAGGYGTPAALRRAVSMGAAGVQVGTAFALCRESGMDRGLKERILRQLAHGEVHVRTDPRASPTGFPFKVVELAATLSDDAVYSARPRLCDLGVLRTPYRKPDGDVGYRCPAEPIAIYVERRGGRHENTVGRRCLCNGLLATAGFAQHRSGDYQEPAIVTAGVDFTAVRELMGRSEGRSDYSAADVVAYLLSQPPPTGLI